MYLKLGALKSILLGSLNCPLSGRHIWKPSKVSSVLYSLVRWSRGCEAATLYDDEDEAAEPIFQSEDDILRIVAGWDEDVEAAMGSQCAGNVSQEEPPFREENGIDLTDLVSEVDPEVEGEVDPEENVDAEEESDADEKADGEEEVGASTTTTSTTRTLDQLPVPLPRTRKLQSRPLDLHNENESASKDLHADISERSSHHAQPTDSNHISMYPDEDEIEGGQGEAGDREEVDVPQGEASPLGQGFG